MRFFFWSRIRAVQRVFFLESSFFFQQKRGSLVLVLCVCSCAEEKIAAAGLQKNCSSRFFIQHKKKNLIYTAGSGEIFINLF